MRDYPAKKKKQDKAPAGRFIVEPINGQGKEQKILLCTAGKWPLLNSAEVIKEYRSMSIVMREEFMKGICYGTFRAQMLTKGFYWINKKHTAKLIFEQPRIKVR